MHVSSRLTTTKTASLSIMVNADTQAFSLYHPLFAHPPPPQSYLTETRDERPFRPRQNYPMESSTILPHPIPSHHTKFHRLVLVTFEVRQRAPRSNHRRSFIGCGALLPDFGAAFDTSAPSFTRVWNKRYSSTVRTSCINTHPPLHVNACLHCKNGANSGGTISQNMGFHEK